MKFSLLALLGTASATQESGLSMLSVMDTIKMDDPERVRFSLETCSYLGDCSKEEDANPRLYAISLARGTHKVDMSYT